ncbi:IDEAL domain-containing protein [Bacillaceae bacterium IKA-2]|nr:IDEAL domain-containing protein [Bacillaceae bacterium IKA-2]
MEKYVINKKVLKQLSLLNNHREPSVEILDSLYAQMILEASIFQFQKSKLQEDIDGTLKDGDKELFVTLVKRYNGLLANYKDGVTFSEEGIEFTIKFED